MILTALPDLEALLGREGRDTLLRLGVTHGEEGRAALAGAGGDAELRHQAHRLRGAVAPFGAAALVALLHRVELGDADATAADAALSEFVTACRAALDG